MGIVSFDVSIYVGMAIYKFCRQCVADSHYIEFSFLLADFGIEKNMEKYIAEFFRDFLAFVLDKGIA